MGTGVTSGSLFLAIGGAFGLTGVGLGAFGAHALKARLGASDMLGTYNTAVQYHQIHALAILAVAALSFYRPNALLITAGWLFVAGILLFSGSLYALALSGVRVLGAITPFGGLAMLAGWACLLWLGARDH